MSSLLRFKAGVLVPKVVIIAAAVVNSANMLRLPADMWVTSGNDSTHMGGSKHYEDLALDFRTRDLNPAEQQALRHDVQVRLGAAYDVVLEKDHLHIEYDPPEDAIAV